MFQIHWYQHAPKIVLATCEAKLEVHSSLWELECIKDHILPETCTSQGHIPLLLSCKLHYQIYYIRLVKKYIQMHEPLGWKHLSHWTININIHLSLSTISLSDELAITLKGNFQALLEVTLVLVIPSISLWNKMIKIFYLIYHENKLARTIMYKKALLTKSTLNIVLAVSQIYFVWHWRTISFTFTLFNKT